MGMRWAWCAGADEHEHEQMNVHEGDGMVNEQAWCMVVHEHEWYMVQDEDEEVMAGALNCSSRRSNAPISNFLVPVSLKGVNAAKLTVGSQSKRRYYRAYIIIWGARRAQQMLEPVHHSQRSGMKRGVLAQRNV